MIPSRVSQGVAHGPVPFLETALPRKLGSAPGRSAANGAAPPSTRPTPCSSESTSQSLHASGRCGPGPGPASDRRTRPGRLSLSSSHGLQHHPSPSPSCRHWDLTVGVDPAPAGHPGSEPGPASHGPESESTFQVRVNGLTRQDRTPFDCFRQSCSRRSARTALPPARRVGRLPTRPSLVTRPGPQRVGPSLGLHAVHPARFCCTGPVQTWIRSRTRGCMIVKRNMGVRLPRSGAFSPPKRLHELYVTLTTKQNLGRLPLNVAIGRFRVIPK